jgi:8-oxo-dGTP pyrophosphatase MutT (NUDIX family)
MKPMNVGDGSPASPIASASVVMLRDAPRGLEVLLLKRHGLSDVHGGAYVFPGGKVDMHDAGLAGRLDCEPATLAELLDETELGAEHAAAIYVAAMREVFEESGVLFGVLGAEGGLAGPGLPAAVRSLDAVLCRSSTSLASKCLVPWSRWITPAASVLARKHFDTRFFVAALPEGQSPVHDERETTESVWLTPLAALGEYCDGRIALAPPQIMSLAQLAYHSTVAGLVAEARSRGPIRIQPEVVSTGQGNIVCFPGDLSHSQPTRVLRGPTRLCWRSGRYEPELGFESFQR